MLDADVLRSQAERRVGQVLCRKWTLDRLIDIGGMAAVFAATHRNGSRVAIKLLHQDLASSEDSKERFLREGYVANRVGHPGAVQVLDDDEEDGAPFLVMELLVGETVEARLKRNGRLSVASALCIADEVLDVLGAAHAQGIVHRDIKPGNLFITEAGQVKVLDFGLARVRELSLKGKSTRTGALLGTVSYMPPEQARGKHDMIDARSDIWAVGALLFRLLTGRVVHEASSTYDRLVKAMTEHAPPLGSVAPELPEGVRDVVDRALAFQKVDRWADAPSMQAAVRSAFEASEHQPIPSLRRALGGPLLRQPEPEVLVEDSDVHVSVLWDQEGEGGQSIIVDVEVGGGASERVELRRKTARPPGASREDDELSEVTVVEEPRRPPRE